MFRTRIKNFVYPLLFMALAGGFVAAIHFLKNFGFDRMVARVEEAVVQEPDSAISMLDSLSAGFLTEEEAALYALLYTEAVFEKEHHIHDSTLQVAYAYFVEEGKGDIPRELTVKLYHGLGLLEEGKQVEAFLALLDVYEQREALPGMHQKNLLCRYLGEIYRRNALYQEAERRFGEDSLSGLAERGERAEGIDARLAKDVAVAEMRFEREKELRVVWQWAACIILLLSLFALGAVFYSYRKKKRERRLMSRILKYVQRIHSLDEQLSDSRKVGAEKVKLEQDMKRNVRMLAVLRGNLKDKELQLEDAQRKFATAMLMKCYLSKRHSHYGDMSFDYHFLLEGYEGLSEEKSSYCKKLKGGCPALTARECFICILYHEGFSDEEVMEALGTSKATFKVVKSRLFSKCGKEALA